MDLFVHGKHTMNQVLLPLDLVEDMLWVSEAQPIDVFLSFIVLYFLNSSLFLRSNFFDFEQHNL